MAVSSSVNGLYLRNSLSSVRKSGNAQDVTAFDMYNLKRGGQVYMNALISVVNQEGEDGGENMDMNTEEMEEEDEEEEADEKVPGYDTSILAAIISDRCNSNFDIRGMPERGRNTLFVV